MVDIGVVWWMVVSGGVIFWVFGGVSEIFDWGREK